MHSHWTKVIENFERECLSLHATRRSRYRRRIGIQLTTACPVECSHCLWACNASNTVDLPVSILDKCLNQWQKIDGTEEVGFTGGEPFFRLNLLQYAIKKASKLGIRPSVVTSAYWAKTFEEALSCLKKLRGLFQLCISVDRYHQKSIPSKNIINAINAAKRLNIKSRILIVLSDSHITKDIESLTKHLYFEIQPEMIQMGAMLNYGRAKHVNRQPYLTGANTTFCGLETPLLLSNGDIFLCCVPSAKDVLISPFYRGNLKQISLTKALFEDIEDFWLLQCLRAGGPSLVAELTAQRLHSKKDPTLLCDLCVDFFSNQKKYLTARRRIQNEAIHYQIATLVLKKRGDTIPFVRYVMQK